MCQSNLETEFLGYGGKNSRIVFPSCKIIKLGTLSTKGGIMYAAKAMP